MEVIRREVETAASKVVYESRYVFNQTTEVTMTLYPKEPIPVAGGWEITSPAKMSTRLGTSDPELAIDAMMLLMASNFSDVEPLQEGRVV